MDNDATRQRIISSVFSKLNSTGHQETYAGHIKIWEDAGPDGKKPRYILLSQVSNGGGCIHKAKLNSNGSFSVGKTWNLQELRGVEVVNPLAFNITLARTYRWQTENQTDQANFITVLIQLFRMVAGGASSLQLVGVRENEEPSSSRQAAPPPFARLERAPTPTNGGPLPPATPRHVNGFTDVSTRSYRNNDVSAPVAAPPTPASRIQQSRRPSQASARTDIPEAPRTTTPLNNVDRSSTPTRNRPTTPTSQQPPSSLRPRMGRRPSNATSTRTSASTNSQVPSISIPIQPVPLRSPTDSVTSPAWDSRVNGIPRTTIDTSSLSISVAPVTPSSSFATPSPLSTYPSTINNTPRLRPRSPPNSRRPSRANSFVGTDSGQTRREQNTRVSFFDPANQAALDRILSGGTFLQTDGEPEGGGAVEVESAQATLTSVEEMLEGYEWASEDMTARTLAGGTADQIEARLLDELLALDKANVHSFIESDDRITTVLKFLDDAIVELDGMDSIVSSYKIHLNAVNDDIAFIQSQNRGLQVQTQNQRDLLNELEELLQTVQVDREALLTLTQDSLEQSASIQRLEEAATQLYKALQASRDRDMAMTMERLDEYRTHNSQFCKRMYDFLSIMFTAQSKLLLGDSNGIVKTTRGRPKVMDHKNLETYLGRYSGLMLYLKEMDENVYAKLCAAYFSASSALHSTQIKALMVACNNLIKKSTEEDGEVFSTTPSTINTSRTATGIRRAGTLVRSPLDRKEKTKEQLEGDMRASKAFGLLLEQIAPVIYHEEDFIADFLQINDAALTFADYMGLENYFRRQAARSAGLSQSTTKLVRGALDLIFGFLASELKAWLDTALAKDHVHIIGIIACLERFLADAEERGNAFFLNLLEKQHVRLKGLFDRRINEQIKSVGDTKLTSKKRKGVAPFVKFFPVYVGRAENQLIGSDTLEIRQLVDAAYDKIVQSMFDSLKQMAKLDGEDEDKGQLNYHVILIENMHHFVAEISQLEIGSVVVFLKRAEAIYDENLNAYVKLALRRPFAKIIDYFEGIERLLRTTAPTEISSNSSYSKSALKKIVREYTTKDIRKNIDTLFKRVEKHFTESSEKTTTEETSTVTGIAPGTVMVGVWKALEEELLRITELFSKRISQCYHDTGVTLEYTAADVEAAFKRHRVDG